MLAIAVLLIVAALVCFAAGLTILIRSLRLTRSRPGHERQDRRP